MSMRGTKRATVVRDAEQPSTSGTGNSSSKRRRTDPDDPLWQLRPVSDLKMSSIYNRSAPEAPAELFRKDLISAMKLPDNEPLTSSEYWIITDPWKQDWERGVQVPVNPDSLPAPKVKIIDNPLPAGQQPFKLPKDKYVHLARDAHYSAEQHQLSSTPACAEAACTYDIDATDACWLKLLNAERARAGASAITENQFEKVIEELEVRTWDKIQAIMKSEEGLGIEYDENVICDVCRSPDSEDGNEMVFCDSCNICVHQACYGITLIPDGQWLCRPCGDGVRPTCVLCPNQGGAMKCTPSGHKWAHVSCVLWIPEVSIGCAEKMEPITKISSIPASRWSLVCVLCRERKGACIQCSVKSCKTAYHVTCAFKHGLEMRAIIEDENADDGVKLRSYCQKHSVNSKKEKSGSGSEEEEVKRKRRKDMTSEEKTQARAARLHEIEKEFEKHVSVKDISSHLLDVDQDAINYIYNYWKLKRRSVNNRPLVPPKSDDNELLSHRQEQADLDKMKMFVQLRQDLERVRNLCYMVSRREKLSRSFFRLREQTFHKQMAVVSGGAEIPQEELAAIYEANHGPSIYDTMYSHPDVPEHKINFEELLAKIAPPDSNDDKKKDRNGLRRSKSSNPYRKLYVNGSRRSGSMYSGLSSEESDPEIARSSKHRSRAIGSTTDDEKKPSTSSPKKKVSPKAKAIKKSPRKNETISKKKKKTPQSKAVVVDSSSEEDPAITRPKKDKSASKTLRQMEKEMTAVKTGHSGSESDELMPIRSTRTTKFPIDIYSDSSEDSANDKSVVKKDIDKLNYDKDEKVVDKSPSTSDAQQSLPRTKAAMKEFVPSHSDKKEPASAEDKPAPKKRGRKPSNKDKKPPVKTHESDDEAKNKENKFSKPKDNPTDLIVPQRQAAKKASENMRSTSTGKKEENAIEKSPEEVKVKAKGKGKGKEIKSPPAKPTRHSSKDAEKETIAYVPQRQAAKKAAAHIKNIGSKVPAPETPETSKKKDEKPESSKSSDESANKKKQDTKESSSSSSSSSSSYSSSSSSSEEQEPEKSGPKPTAKAREIKPASKPSVFSPPSARPTVDLPFLDKVSRPLSSTSGESDSESSRSERSGSSSPGPRRPRRRRKRASGDSPRKAPDKKLKTSEREPSRGQSPAPAEESPAARPAARTRTGSVVASGSQSDLPAAARKPSKDDSSSAVTADETAQASRQSSELPPPERKANEEAVKDRRRSSPKVTRRSSVMEPEAPKNDIKPKPKLKRPSVSDEKPSERPMSPADEPKPSPKKNMERRKSVSSRRMSVKEPQKDTKDQVVPTAEEVIKPIKQRRQSRYEARDTKPTRESISPNKKPVVEKPQAEVPDKKTPIRLNDEFNDSEKWLPKAPSPTHVLTPIERPGGNEKYMTDDKSFDSGDISTEKSSVKMIAKIQANLNENTMIKSPRTPMDARSLAPDDDNPAKNMRKRSTLETVTQQDASHVQGVEISKSAKIPSTVYHERPPTSPQQKDNELFAFDMLAVDDGFNHEEMMKPFSSYPEFFFKEDSKEQGRQETLNLVDRLRMQLSAKKAPENCQQEPSTDDKDHMMVDDHRDEYRNDDYRSDDYREDHRVDDNKNQERRMQDMLPIEHNKHDGQLSPSKEMRSDIETRMRPSPQHLRLNHLQHSIAPAEMPRRKSLLEDKEYRPMAMTSDEKWHPPPSLEDHDSRKYDHSVYNDEGKEPSTVSASEVGDTNSLSKQSDDSQPSGIDNSNSVIDVEMIQDTQHNYENNNSVIRSECDAISSPYVGREAEWRESKIPRRRSSASSTESEGSGAKARMSPVAGGGMPEIDSYPPIPAYSCPVEPSMPLNQYATYPPDASPFLTTMSSLFGGGACSQLPLPSPGPLYAPGLAFSSSGLLPPKPPFPQLCAAFTSSSQNIALTTAMIAPPTPKPVDSPSRDDTIDVTGSDKFSLRASSPTICVDDSTYENSQSRAAKMSNDSNETVTSGSQQECKSPAKLIPPLKPPIKFPGKSPGKSPGISPKQSEAPKGSKRANNRNNRGNRGRGRSKSRGQSHPYPPVDYIGDSIQNKFVGTVYDFEEEIANDGVDLKSLRERRKSIDVRDDRRSEHSFKDASQSPRLQSPPRASKKTPTSEPKDYGRAPVEETDRNASSGGESRSFTHVPPLLPGPVDMRTYQPEPVDTYHHQMLGYTAGVAERHLADLEEEQAAPPAPVPAPPPPAPPPYVPNLPKVSLSDSRNQLKVKIKGPFLDANYCASTVTPAVVPPPAPALDPPVTFNAAAGASSGSTSLRRMRKKELLRQYWTQDMNMDEPTSAVVPPPAAQPPPPRAVITIPKAVASMTSIPTREDYKILDPPVLEIKKKRKVSGGLPRELRHLKVTMNDEPEPTEDSKLSSLAHKRRARLSKPPKSSPAAPKLKIKLGANTVQVSDEPSDFRPPKKRLIHKPSLEDLRRESMKYRKMVMADFEENEKTTKHKSSKSEKRKKKKDKKVDKLQVVNSESESAPKLIIKIKRPLREEAGGAGASGAAAAAPEPAVDPFDYDPSAPDPLAIDTPTSSEGLSAMRKVRTAKVTPIRLKLARTQGSSYVMKEAEAGGSEAPQAAASAPQHQPDVR